MPLIICDKSIQECLPCNDDPLLNISAEDPDQDVFISNWNYQGNRDLRLGQTFLNAGCLAICTSSVSQDDADDCALRQAQECAWETWRDPDGKPIVFFGNNAQSCTKTCPDGRTFTWLQSGNTVFAMSQLEANSLAFDLACKRAQANKICISTTELTWTLNIPATRTLQATGGTAFVLNNINFGDVLIQCPTENSTEYDVGDVIRYIWTIVSGSLPSGLELNGCAGTISGTPVEVGDFPITVRATDAIGSYQEKQITIRVEGAACPEAPETSWLCPSNSPEKRIVIVEGDPCYPIYVNSINRVIVPSSDGINVFSIIDFTQPVPVIENTIGAGVIGSNPAIVGEGLYHEPTDQIIALIRTGAVAPFNFFICFYRPSDRLLVGSIFLGTATFGGRLGTMFAPLHVTGKIALAIHLNNTQTFNEIYIINPVTHAIAASRDMPAGRPQEYTLCYICSQRQIAVARGSNDTIYKFDDETLALEGTFTIGDTIDRLNYIDSTDKLWAYSRDVSPEFVDVINVQTGTVETTFNVVSGNVRGHPIYNMYLDAWIIGLADINGGITHGLLYYNVDTFAVTCTILRDWDVAQQDDEMGSMGYDSDTGIVYTHSHDGAFHLEKVTPT